MQRLAAPQMQFSQRLPLLLFVCKNKATTHFDTMKYYFHLRLLLSLLFLTGLNAQAQEDATAQEQDAPTEEAIRHSYSPWEIGLFAGAANAYGDVIDTRFIQFSRTNLAYGGVVRFNANRNLSIRASFIRGQLKGSDLDSEALAARGLSFESTINELAIVGQWDLWGHKRYNDNGGFSSVISPYLFAGFGLGLNDLQTDYSSLSDNPALTGRAAQDMQNSPNSQFTLPFGIGINTDLSERLLLSFEFGWRPIFNDYLDGISATANPDRNDWYSMGGTSLAYRLVERDGDEDGIPDHKDLCPNIWGPEEHLGCPDSDNDGIADRLDRCPEREGSAATNGCPDSDGDGVADDEDLCPDIPGPKSASGCSDLDGDGIPDADDECPSIAGPPELNGCRDTDKDGLPDYKDRCPYQKGAADSDGCPPPPDPNDASVDSDGDGIPDMKDECPSIPGSPELKGCKDVDNDGIADPKDQCPYIKGSAANQGCPTPRQDTSASQPGIVEKKDTDGDGIADAEDLCPDRKGLAKDSGCPDSDKDGLADHIDDCPQTAGPRSRQGCPELTTADIEVLQTAVDNVSFNQGSYSLLSSSHQTLDMVAELMQRYPTYHLKIVGHTDNQGNPQANKRLSELRAKACMEYLEEQGISKGRIAYEGLGGEQPRATNDTRSGRRRNRRVEFDLFDPNN